jgi:hypothetical protein
MQVRYQTAPRSDRGRIIADSGYRTARNSEAGNAGLPYPLTADHEPLYSAPQDPRDLLELAAQLARQLVRLRHVLAGFLAL